MAKKKEPSTPLPQSLASFHNATFDHLQSKNSSQSNSATIVEGDEMVTPGPSIVHPSAGPISRKELKNRIGLVMFQGIQEKSNGTVPTSSAKGSGSGSKSSSPPVVEVSLPVSDDWSDLFKGKWNAQGMKLGFVPPVVKDGTSVAQLQATELEQGNAKWSTAIIFYVIGIKPTIAAVASYIAQFWNQVAKPEIFLHEDGFFVVRLCSEDDKRSILYSGPHMFYGKPTVVKPWYPDFDFHSEVLRTFPIWIQFPNLALNCWSADTLSRLSSVVGVPICADECTSRQLRVSFARVLVEVDVTKPLPTKVSVADPDGKLMEQEVMYEWTPPFASNAIRWGMIALRKWLLRRRLQKSGFLKLNRFLRSNRTRFLHNLLWCLLLLRPLFLWLLLCNLHLKSTLMMMEGGELLPKRQRIKVRGLFCLLLISLMPICL